MNSKRCKLLYVYKERIPKELRNLVLSKIPVEEFDIASTTYSCSQEEMCAHMLVTLERPKTLKASALEKLREAITFGEFKPGDTVSVLVQRGEERLELSVKLGGR